MGPPQKRQRKLDMHRMVKLLLKRCLQMQNAREQRVIAAMIWSTYLAPADLRLQEGLAEGEQKYDDAVKAAETGHGLGLGPLHICLAVSLEQLAEEEVGKDDEMAAAAKELSTMGLAVDVDKQVLYFKMRAHFLREGEEKKPTETSWAFLAGKDKNTAILHRGPSAFLEAKGGVERMGVVPHNDPEREAQRMRRALGGRPF